MRVLERLRICLEERESEEAKKRDENIKLARKQARELSDTLYRLSLAGVDVTMVAKQYFSNQKIYCCKGIEELRFETRSRSRSL